MNEKVKFLSKGGALANGSSFIHKDDWTLETILEILRFSPQALFGGSITSYRTEELPLFLIHLEEVMPTVYAQIADKYPAIIKAMVPEKKNYVGRTAVLQTVVPCVFFTSGSRDGEYRVQWTWDGTKLTTDTRHAYAQTWGEVQNFEKVSTTIIPNEKTTIKITDNAQVNSSTVFID